MARIELTFAIEGEKVTVAREFSDERGQKLLEHANDPLILRVMPSMPLEDGVTTLAELADVMLEGALQQLVGAAAQVEVWRAQADKAEGISSEIVDPSPSERKTARLDRIAAAAEARLPEEAEMAEITPIEGADDGDEPLVDDDAPADAE